MTRATRVNHRCLSRRYRAAAASPYPSPSPSSSSCKCEQVPDKNLEIKDYEDAICSVCLECPHHAVLLLCSSHDKGCRPYMCATSFRYSNCLDQYQKAYKKSDELALACPLCRGQVKGWTVVEAARDYLNAKKRTCVQDNCIFSGSYKQLRRHVKVQHPCAQPRKVDPVLEQQWRSLEHEREHDDVMSTIRSSMPGAMVLGDYVIEQGGDDDDDDDENGNFSGFDDRNVLNVLLFLQALERRRSVRGNAQVVRDEGDGDQNGRIVRRQRRRRNQQL